MRLAYPTAALLRLAALLGCDSAANQSSPPDTAQARSTAKSESPKPAKDVDAEDPSAALVRVLAEPGKEVDRKEVGKRAASSCLTYGQTANGKGLNSAYVQDLGVVANGGSLANMQHAGAASWLDLERLKESVLEAANMAGVPSEQMEVAFSIFTIDAQGVHEATAVATVRGSVGLPDLRTDPAEASKRPAAGTDRYALATRSCVPPPEIHLETRRLSKPGTGADKAAKWATRQEGEAFVAVGEVLGHFGGGVDRVVVVAPEQRAEADDDSSQAEEMKALCQGEFAIAMKGDRVHGALSVVRPVGKKGQQDCAEHPEGTVFASGLEVAALVDLDNDGTEEILWTYHASTEPRTQYLVLTGLSGGTFERWELASHSYAGCEVFLDPNNCGRAVRKPNP